MTSQLRAAVVEDTGFPAPLPEWKTPAQLKVWRAEKTAKTLAKEAAARAAQVKAVASSATPAGFYTGKPYMAESGTYAFKYREYNPEMGRWTTVDPSGFPDGANNRVYAAVPTSQIDNGGLSVRKLYHGGTWASNFTADVQIDKVNGPTLNSFTTGGFPSVLSSVTSTGVVITNPTQSTPQKNEIKWDWTLQGTFVLTFGIAVSGHSVSPTFDFPFSTSESYVFE